MNEIEELEKAAEWIWRKQMGTTQFYHDLIRKVTYAVDVPFNKEDLLETVHAFNRPIIFNVGTSKVHPKDRYNKKVGRELSSQRITPVEFRFVTLQNSEPNGITPWKARMYLHFKSMNNELNVMFGVNKNSDKPYLLKIAPNIYNF